MSGTDYFEVSGTVITADELKTIKAKAVVEALRAELLPYSKFIECRLNQDSSESVVFEVEVQRPQIRKFDIRRSERILAVFHPTDGSPSLYALRKDFPSVPHAGLSPTGTPRWICLYYQPWHEIRLDWTAPKFIERVRWWLAETSKGTLHKNDQPMEPLLYGTGRFIVVPPDIFDTTGNARLDLLAINPMHDGEKNFYFAARHSANSSKDLEYLGIALRCAPVEHGIIRFAPRNLKDLFEFTKLSGTDIFYELRDIVGLFSGSSLLNARFLMLLAFPKIRDLGTSIEASDVWTFMSENTMAEVGSALGLWSIDERGVLAKLEADNGDEGKSIAVSALATHFNLTRQKAAELNGEGVDNRKIVAIGMGAVGSQLFLDLWRSGYGRWTLFDDDRVFPHNLARHASDWSTIGYNKAACMSVISSGMYSDVDAVEAISANVLNPGSKSAEVRKAFDEAELIVDMSASIAVARFIAIDVQARARRASFFLNPRGLDSVLLLEGTTRAVRLDMLEMQYYRQLIISEKLRDHLLPPPDQIRVSLSCREVTSRIPQDYVAMMAAIGSRALRQLLAKKSQSICLWRIDSESLAVDCCNITSPNTLLVERNEWKIYLDEFLVKKLLQLRRIKLPRETGGVLLGSFDVSRRIVYVMDTLPPPPDSEEWPAAFIRGSEHLERDLKFVAARTAGNLGYVGEWHSHPSKCSCTPSSPLIKGQSFRSDITPG